MTTTRPERSVARASSTHAAARSWSGARAPCAGRGWKHLRDRARGRRQHLHERRRPRPRRRTPPATRHRTRPAGTGGCRAARWRASTPSIGPGGRSARDSTPSGCWSRWAGERSTATYRSAVMHCRAGGEHGPGQRPGTGAGVDHGERVGTAEADELGVEEAGDDRSEERADLGRGEEVATPAGLPGRGSGVEAVLAVQGEVHELPERDRPAGRPDGAADVVSRVQARPRLTDRGRR